jgi:hypothetical protein
MSMAGAQSERPNIVSGVHDDPLLLPHKPLNARSS